MIDLFFEVTRARTYVLLPLESFTELAKKYTLNSEQINKWKREFKTKASLLFTKDYKEPEKKEEQEKQKLFEIIGQQKVEIDFLKKALS